MSRNNLFSQLAGYSLNPHKRSIENFTTELLAHFFNEEIVFRRRFLALIFADKRMILSFEKAWATTQEPLGKDCRVDLVLRTATAAHLIEVKVAAGETLSARWGQRGMPQVQRYLELRKGHVTYLTTRDSPAPDTDGRGRKYRMIKHALFEDLYVALRATTVAPLVGQFLDFMKENNMAGPHPFSRREIRRADESMHVLQKCIATLAIVKSEANAQFRRNLNTYANLTRPTYNGLGDDGGEVQCYLPNLKRDPIKSVGLSISPSENELFFCVWMWGKLDPAIDRIVDYLEWDRYAGEHGCVTCIKLNGTPNDIPRMIEHAEKASRKLGRAIKKYVG